MSTVVVCTITTPVQLWNIFSTSKRCGGLAKFLLSVSFIYVFWLLLISETRTMVWIGSPLWKTAFLPTALELGIVFKR